MRRYLNESLPLAIFAILLLIISGCSDGGFETASRFEVVGASPPIIQSDIVEDTDDYGIDGVAGTGDQGENDNRPQPGEEVTNPLTEDEVTVQLANFIREDAPDGKGVDIEIYKYVISYYDNNGYTPIYAPQTIHDTQMVIRPGTMDNYIDVIVIDMPMKMGWLKNNQWIMGIRDIYLYDYSNFNYKLFAQIDFYARDTLNNVPAFSSCVVEVHFANYLP